MKTKFVYILTTAIICFLISYFFFSFKEKPDFIKLTDNQFPDCLIKVDKKTNQTCIITSSSCRGYFKDLPKVCETK